MSNREQDLKTFDNDTSEGVEILREAGLIDEQDVPAVKSIIADEREKLATGHETLAEAENSAGERVAATTDARTSGALASDDDGDDLDR
jgi:hypothetical protein